MNKSNTEKQDKDLWATPWWVFWFAEAYFGIKFDLDVCAMAHNKKVKKYISPEQNTLITEWDGRFCWCNPPYSNPLPFVERAIEQSQQHNKVVVMLLNADNSTKWFERCVNYASWVVFITRGRIPFIHNSTGKETKGNSKGQMLVLFTPNSNRLSPRTSYIPMQEIREIGNQWAAEQGYRQ